MGKIFSDDIENINLDYLMFGGENYEFPNMVVASTTIYQAGLAVSWDCNNAAVALANSDAVCRGENSLAFADQNNAIALQRDSIAIAEGDGGISIALDVYSKALSKGKNGIAIATDFNSEAEVRNGGIATALSPTTTAAGSIGSWLVLVEYNWDENADSYNKEDPIKEVRAVKVDGKDILPGVFYKLRDGNVIPYYKEDYGKAVPEAKAIIPESVKSSAAADEIRAMEEVALGLASIPPKKGDTLRK